MKIFTSILFLLFFSSITFGQTQNDTLFCYHTKTPPTIDGQATEECWENAEWNAIDQVWIPWGTTMKDGDFEGRFKVAWDEDLLYVLVEVVDDSLSDDYSNPLEKWWEDDCLEIFIDENRSMGDHTRNNNAFAYHVSLFYDAVDLTTNGQANFKMNLEVEMDTIGDNKYLWEFAIKNYDARFTFSQAERSRVKLHHDKHMGFAIAYCDNDETMGRENFIGSMVMTEAQHNDMYKNADHFGLMFLVDPEYVPTKVTNVDFTPEFEIYPVPAGDFINIKSASLNAETTSVSIFSITGQLVKSLGFSGNAHQINIEDLKKGIYILKIEKGAQIYTRRISKQ